MMAISYTSLPTASRLHACVGETDFLDCVHGAKYPASVSAAKAAYIAMAEMPVWVERLMWLRNIIVTPFGLKTGRRPSFGADVPDKFEVGDYIGIFKVESISDNEIIIGEDDKHLNFRVTIYRSDNGYYLATWVHPHNWLGRTYLKLVMPFHRIITQNCMKRLVAR